MDKGGINMNDKKKFSYVVTFLLYNQTGIKIQLGNKIYEYINTVNDYNTANGCNTVAVLYDLKAMKHVAFNIVDEKLNKKECIILPNQ